MTGIEKLEVVRKVVQNYNKEFEELQNKYASAFARRRKFEEAVEDWANKYFGKYIKDKQYDKMYCDFTTLYDKGYLTINIEEVLGYMEYFSYETFVVPEEFLFKDLTRTQIVSCKEE